MDLIQEAMGRVKAGQSLLPLMAGLAPGDELTLALVEKLLKYLKAHPQALRVTDHQRFVVELSLGGLGLAEVARRQRYMSALRGLLNLLQIYHDGLLPSLAQPDLLAALRVRLADPGSDLDERGGPLQRGGNLKISQLALECLKMLPKAVSLEPRWRGAQQGLLRVHAWMFQDRYEGTALATHLIGVLNELLQCEEPFPDPEFFWELLDLVNSSEYSTLSPEALMALVRWLPMRQRYWHSMLELIASDRNRTWSDQMWALFASEQRQRGQIQATVRKALAEGRLRSDLVPPEYHL